MVNIVDHTLLAVHTAFPSLPDVTLQLDHLRGSATCRE